jgi:pyridoxal phosphate enzyme (YggS family)
VVMSPCFPVPRGFSPLVGYSLLVSISQNIAQVRERIAAAALRAGRRPEEIALMAVTKTFPPVRIREAYDAGLRLFGENRVQEFAAKADALRDLRDAQWRMIGHLQANKAAKAVGLFSGIDSVDSLRLAQRLNSSAREIGRKIPVLIEINIGGEQAKSGVASGSAELEDILRAAPELDYLAIRGVMTVPPFTEDPEGARPYFKQLRELQKEIAARKLPGLNMSVLSMGMSHDFEIAVEEGSTCVRVGTAIFGERG